jgi:hypothetical protein
MGGGATGCSAHELSGLPVPAAYGYWLVATSKESLNAFPFPIEAGADKYGIDCERLTVGCLAGHWNALPSGGCLAIIAAGKIDIVVVYKIDRLTRSLIDFAKLVETMDRAEVRSVSVLRLYVEIGNVRLLRSGSMTGGTDP